MQDDFLFTVCCPSCGTVVGKSFKGSRTYVHCPKCSAELFYETRGSGPIIKILKEPKSPPIVPAVPA